MFNILYCKENKIPITKYKNYSFQIDYIWNLYESVTFDVNFLTYEYFYRIYFNLFGLFEFELSHSRRSDHAGFQFTLAILIFELLIGTYDRRHWDDETNSWQVYSISIKELLERPIIRTDYDDEWMNKMTEEEINQWEREVEEELEAKGVSRKFPDWNSAFLCKQIDRGILYKLFQAATNE